MYVGVGVASVVVTGYGEAQQHGKTCTLFCPSFPVLRSLLNGAVLGTGRRGLVRHMGGPPTRGGHSGIVLPPGALQTSNGSGFTPFASGNILLL